MLAQRGESALIKAVCTCNEHSKDIVKALLEAKADVNAEDKVRKNHTPLSAAPRLV